VFAFPDVDGPGVGPSPELSRSETTTEGVAPSGRAAASVPTDLSFIKEPRRHLSFSQLSTYSECGEKFRLRYVENVPTSPHGAFLGGRAIHKTIEESEGEVWWKDEDAFARADAVAIARFREIFDAEVEEAGGVEAIRWGGRGQGEDVAWWHKNGEFMLRRYRLTRVAMAESGWDVVEGGVEMRVLAELPGVSVPVVGYLDKLLMHDAGEPVVVDYSTGRVGGKNALQFATYAALLAMSRGLEVDRGVAIYLRAPDASKRVQPVIFAELVPRIAETYAKLVRGIEAEVFVPNPSAFCKSCAVNSSCWYWTGSQP